MVTPKQPQAQTTNTEGQLCLIYAWDFVGLGNSQGLSAGPRRLSTATVCLSAWPAELGAVSLLHSKCLPDCHQEVDSKTAQNTRRGDWGTHGFLACAGPSGIAHAPSFRDHSWPQGTSIPLGRKRAEAVLPAIRAGSRFLCIQVWMPRFRQAQLRAGKEIGVRLRKLPSKLRANFKLFQQRPKPPEQTALLSATAAVLFHVCNSCLPKWRSTVTNTLSHTRSQTRTCTHTHTHTKSGTWLSECRRRNSGGPQTATKMTKLQVIETI